MRQAQAQLGEDGLTTTDGYGGVKPHPAATIEERSRIAFLRAMRELGLDLEAPPTTQRFHALRHAYASMQLEGGTDLAGRAWRP